MKKILRAIKVIDTGEQVWRAIAPVNKVKRALNKRRARKGKPLLVINDDEEGLMFPKGTMTKGGLVIAMFGPMLSATLVKFGVPAECVVDAPPDCVSAAALSAVLIGLAVTAVGSVIGWLGKRRADAGYPGIPK